MRFVTDLVRRARLGGLRFGLRRVVVDLAGGLMMAATQRLLADATAKRPWWKWPRRLTHPGRSSAKP